MKHHHSRRRTLWLYGGAVGVRTPRTEAPPRKSLQDRRKRLRNIVSEPICVLLTYLSRCSLQNPEGCRRNLTGAPSAE